MPVMVVPLESLARCRCWPANFKLNPTVMFFFPIPVKQMGLWFTADSFSKHGL